MTIDEAIEVYTKFNNCRNVPNEECLLGKNCKECEYDYSDEQCSEAIENVVEWLKELKFLREWKEDIMKSLAMYDCVSIEEAVDNAYNEGINAALRAAKWD